MRYRILDSKNWERLLAKFICSLVIGFLVFGLQISSSRAEPVPERAIGIWSVTACSGEGLTVLVNSSSALLIKSEGAKTRVALAAAEWASGHFVLTMEGKINELVLPSLDNLERCDVLPGSMPVMFAEAVVFFKRFDEINALCMGDNGITVRCIAVAFDMVDVTGDGTFSRAEISRVIRAASFFIGHRLVASEQSDPFVPLEDLYIAQLAASAIGPFVAVNLIDSYDYDNDGVLSPGELMQDRKPEEGVAGILASEASEMAPEALAALLKSVTALFGLIP